MENIPFNSSGNKELAKTEQSSNVLEKQQLYKQIQLEIESVAIGENDRDTEGNFLAPNGKKSHLPEMEWKMTRTPSFLEKFGNWREKYNKEEYALWLKYQEKQTYEDEIKSYKQHQEQIYSTNIVRLDISDDGRDYNVSLYNDYQKWILSLTHKISKLQAELINSGFNIHSYDLDYTKVLDENGEPLLLYRGTNFGPDENGKFTVPKKEIGGKEFEVGIFLGLEDEAKHHHEGRKKDGDDSKLYKAFVNGRNFKIFDEKPNYWNNPKDSKDWQGKYDGLWVKANSQYANNDSANLMDYVCFDPNDVLVVGVE